MVSVTMRHSFPDDSVMVDRSVIGQMRGIDKLSGRLCCLTVAQRQRWRSDKERIKKKESSTVIVIHVMTFIINIAGHPVGVLLNHCRDVDLGSS